MINVRVQFHDHGPDEQGRRRFTLLWENPRGVENPGPQEIPRNCAQCFRADPKSYSEILKNAVVLPPEID